jgi:hypothetical protein
MLDRLTDLHPVLQRGSAAAVKTSLVVEDSKKEEDRMRSVNEEPSERDISLAAVNERIMIMMMKWEDAGNQVVVDEWDGTGNENCKDTAQPSFPISEDHHPSSYFFRALQSTAGHTLTTGTWTERT